MLKDRVKHFGLVLVFVIGFLLGWLVIGWWLWPVQWVNTDPWDLKPEFKKHYILMAAESYAVNSNPELLKERFKGWPSEDLAALLNELKRENPGDTLLLSRLEAIKSALNLPGPEVIQPTPTPQGPRKGPGIILGLGIVSVLLGLVVVLGLAFRLLKGQTLKVPFKLPTKSAKPSPKPQVQRVIEGEYKYVPVLAQYSATYTYGDIRMVESFPIEGKEGEYLGECGIESAELVASGDPPKIGAFEVWLFDKDSSRTVSKYIAVPKADEAMLASLESRSSGVITAKKGQIIRLETENLECKVLVEEVEFGNEGTFFSHLKVSFEVYKKQAARG